MFQCYLNVPVKEAIKRAKASGQWFDDFEHFIIEEFTFTDCFDSYDCHADNRRRYNQNGELLENGKLLALKCTCDKGHICDGNRGHNAGGCPESCPVHSKV